MNKIHAVGNTRKAQAISDFVETKFMRDMVSVDDLSTQNWLYEAWLEQITNSDFMYHPESNTALWILGYSCCIICQLTTPKSRCT